MCFQLYFMNNLNIFSEYVLTYYDSKYNWKKEYFGIGNTVRIVKTLRQSMYE